MCGICGVVNAAGAGPQTAAVVRGMSDLIAHRGPDGQGFWDMAHGTLGHRRLAIIDVAGGAQPMFSEDGAIGIVYNGEIYNFLDLRRELESHGHRFRTRSDTEVLVHGYEEWGEDMVDRLRGMFAFAIWDARRERLLVARDRLGIKPFYYWHDEATGEYTFASEIKALFANPSVPRHVNFDRIPEYLLLRFVAGDETLFQSVRELEPGTVGILGAAGWRKRRYWAPTLTADPDDCADAVVEGRSLLDDAVQSHLVSDVGIGTITSGGLDSSLISALAAAHMPEGIDTFCLGFDDPVLDERPYARQVAQRLRARHHDTVLTVDDFADSLDHLTWVHDEPLSHPNAVAMHKVFVQARTEAQIPVLLSGEGADEVFGGYGWYRAACRLQRIRRLVGSTLASAALRLVLRGAARDLAHPDYLLLANALGRSPRLREVPGVAEAIDRRRALYGHLCTGPAGLFLHDQLTYLQPLLQRQDRMSMAVGLEARVPFLDHRVVEWGNALGFAAKIGSGQPKRLLRRIAEAHLPREIIYREKVGFALPLADWLRGPLRERLSNLDSATSISSEVLGGGAVRRELAALDAGESGPATLLWTLLALEIWREAFADRLAVAGTDERNRLSSRILQ
jgi:asparagine synthase (glutamine-hydrolysing)